MNNFISLMLQIILGVIAYAALMLSSIDIATKIFFGCTVLLWAFHHDLNSFALEDRYEHSLKVILCSLESLENQISDESQKKISESLKDINQVQEWNYILRGSGFSTAITLGIKYAMWIGGGWAISKFFL